MKIAEKPCLVFKNWRISGSAHVLLNLLNKFGKKIVLSVFPNEFNKCNNTGARMQDSIYHMTLKSHFISTFCTKTSQFRFRKRDVFMDVNAYLIH